MQTAIRRGVTSAGSYSDRGSTVSSGLWRFGTSVAVLIPIQRRLHVLNQMEEES
jgi:hypothetical protein